MKEKPTTPKTAHPHKAARRAAVPIMAIESADPEATIRQCSIARNGSPDSFLVWDCIRGLRPLPNAENPNDKAQEIAESIGGPEVTQNLVQMLDAVVKIAPRGASIFIMNAQAALTDYTAQQAIWNCRDVLKLTGSTVVLMGPSLPLPATLSSDVPLFEEPVPTEAAIDAKIEKAISAATKACEKAGKKFPAPSDEDRARIHDTLLGYLSEFAIEQSLALATTAEGIDLRKLWELKVASLKNTAGLEISQPAVNFKDLAGCEGAKGFFGKLIKGRQSIRGVFFLDEIEKMLAGGSGDTSGTSQALVEQFLYWTEAKKVLAVLLLGIPGGGKSHTAACVAGEAKVPLLRGSMSTVKGSLVGQSEGNMKQLLKTVDSVTQGGTLLIATCNSLSSLTPEILARFKLGVFFYDYPSDEESKALWKLYRAKYEHSDAIPPNVSRWVGREIESCCHLAWLFDSSLADAALNIVPVCRANGARMQDLRQSASDRFLAASRPGVYRHDDKKETAGENRSVNL